MTNEPDIGQTLGDLERQIFVSIRERGAAGVGEMVDRLSVEQRPLAYTTVMTVMTRLWEKGFLMRRRQGKAYVYEAREQREIAGDVGGRVARETIEKYGEHALLGFVRTLSPQQRAIVEQLLQEDEIQPDRSEREQE